MTEIPPSQESLETKVVTEPKKVEQQEQPLTRADIIAGLAKGLLPLAAGTVGGYWATGGPGGVGVSLLLTSLGMGLITENDLGKSHRIADYCYKSGLVIGAVISLAAIYVYFEQQPNKK